MTKIPLSRQAEFWSDEGNRFITTDPDMALICYDNALEQMPKHPSYLKQKGNVLIHLKHYAKALDCFDKAHDREGASEALGEWKKHIETLLAQHNPAAAQKEFKERTRFVTYWRSYQEPAPEPAPLPAFPARIRTSRRDTSSPQLENSHNTEGCHYYRDGDFNKALGSFERAIAEDPAEPVYHTNKIYSLINLRRYPDALSACADHPDEQAATTEKNTTLSKWELEIIALIKNGKTEEAATQRAHLATYAESDNDDRIKAKAMLASIDGFIHHRGSRYREALTSFEQALHYDPTEITYHINKVRTLNSLTRFAEATDYCARYPEFPEALAEKSIAINRWEKHLSRLSTDGLTEEFAAQIGLLENYTSRYPEDKEAGGRLAAARGHQHVSAERYTEALACYDQAITQFPNEEGLYSRKITTLTSLNRFSEALAVNPELCGPAHEKPLLDQWEIAIDTLFRIGKTQQAESQLTLLTEYANGEGRDNAKATVETLRGHRHTDAKRYTEALACYDQAIAHAPRDSINHNNKILALTSLNRFHDALIACDALAGEPTTTEIKTGLVRSWGAHINKLENRNEAIEERRALMKYTLKLQPAECTLQSFALKIIGSLTIKNAPNTVLITHINRLDQQKDNRSMER